MWLTDASHLVPARALDKCVFAEHSIAGIGTMKARIPGTFWNESFLKASRDGRERLSPHVHVLSVRQMGTHRGFP